MRKIYIVIYLILLTTGVGSLLWGNTFVNNEFFKKPFEKDMVLEGKIILIDPGHQAVGNTDKEPNGPNSNVMKVKTSYGTVGKVSGTPEYVITLAISQKLRQSLQDLGANVVMTRDTHQVELSNIDRAKMGNQINADIVIRIHADGASDSSLHGISVLYPSFKSKYTSTIAQKSYEVSAYILDEIIHNTGAKNNGLKEREDITGFNWSTVPVILIECGYLSNEKEDIQLNREGYQDQIVSGITKGILGYFNRNS